MSAEMWVYGWRLQARLLISELMFFLLNYNRPQKSYSPGDSAAKELQ